jgi:N-acyl-phosphatidylethanolamine-hydrolysing phospholipase D
VRFDALPPIDVIVQSHNHYDHLDDFTVRALARAHPTAAWLVPLGVGAFVRRRGAREVRELDWWDDADLAAVRFTCTPAQHMSGRTLRDRGSTLWCSWAMRNAAGRGVFFAGDSGFHADFGLIGERCGPFDVACMPIGAYEPRWFMRYLHMNPEEAVRAFRALQARVMVPIHWGTFKLTDEAMDEPPVRARAAWTAAGLPAADYRQLAHGETLTL